MPFQSLISEPALRLADRAAEGGNAQARGLVTYFVGQGVGLVESVTSARSVVQSFMEDFADAVNVLNGPPRDCRRPFGLSYATIGTSCIMA